MLARKDSNPLPWEYILLASLTLLVVASTLLICLYLRTVRRSRHDNPIKVGTSVVTYRPQHANINYTYHHSQTHYYHIQREIMRK